MTTVEEYIQQFDPSIQEKLIVLRQLFHDIVPDVEECIRYKMPSFKVGNHHLYFASYKNYIGFYPIYGLTTIEQEMVVYRAKNTKDTLHFMLDKPLPIELIKKIIQLKLEL